MERTRHFGLSRWRSVYGLVVLTLAAGFLLVFPAVSRAQLATATINGTVKDPSGAVVPSAKVTLVNTATGVARRVVTSSVGSYVIPGIIPGVYQLTVAKTGFVTMKQGPFTLVVNQTATLNFTLRVGSTTQQVTVAATAVHLEASTAAIGTTIGTTKVNNLPLNGRNFTEMLDLTPGVSRVSTAQNGGGGGMWGGNALGSFSFPSVNGQTNRSNLFYLDGVIDQGSMLSTYATPPILDQIQEFKVQSHNGQAEYGGTLGGIVNVATKTGTDKFRGDVWEFLRNNAFDARNPFVSTVAPLKQNEFGGTIGGPVILPHYNGKDKTFFFAGYEGFRNHTAAQSLYRVPTPAELNGDLSDISAQIYNPFTTRPDPANPGEYLRDPFPGNQIPQNLLSQPMVDYAKAVYPAPITTGIPGINGIDNTPLVTNQDTGTLRVDEQLNSKNSFWVRYTGYAQKVNESGGFVGATQDLYLHGYDAGVSYTHIFSSNVVMDATLGRDSDDDNLFRKIDTPADEWQTIGFAANYASGFAGGRAWLPGVSIPGFAGWLPGIQFTTLADIWQMGGNLSIVHGHHTLKTGVMFNTNDMLSPIEYLQDGFNSFQTSNPESTTATGSALASFLLGVPDSANRRNVLESSHGGWVDGFYVQDQWQVTPKLTVNMGLRYDLTLIPLYGEGTNAMVGDLNLANGTYVVEKMAPACSPTQGAPCIPGGTLPAHVLLTPYKNGAIYSNTYDNIAPRMSLAYRLFSKTALRMSFGRFFDNWAAVMQEAQNYEGTWPSMGQIIANSLNYPTPANLTPTVSALDPLGLGSGPAYPDPTPFNQVQWYMNPKHKNPESWQWNFGIQHQFGAATVLTANYVGSTDRRTDVGLTGNAAVTPGPGDIQSRAPYPYIAPTFYDDSIGSANYNAFQFSLNGRRGNGLTYLVSYTWSKAMNVGSDGWFGADGTFIQDPYNRMMDYSVAGYDLTHMFSASAVYRLPFGSGQQFQSHSHFLNAIVGGWRLNGIATFSSGNPYTVSAPTGSVNTGTYWLSANVTGDPHLSSPTTGEWINTSAFSVPAPYTFGNVGRNSLRSAWYHDVDLSIFRDFTISETTRLQFRFESFNAFNNPIWSAPDSGITDPNFGRVLGIAHAPRELQLALKLYF